MSAIALVGTASFLLPERVLRRILLPVVAFSAGSLLGGALFHMIPAAIDQLGNHLSVYIWLALGFVLFFSLEQFLHWHHCHRVTSDHLHHAPLTYLVLLADALHNFIGGLGVGGSFIADVRLGITAWFVAAAHEVPQELGDFGVLIHGGWSRRAALLFNLLSALTFPVGGLLAYAASRAISVKGLVPFAAGNFIYIAAADLIPEVKHSASAWRSVVHFSALVSGLALLLGIRYIAH